jgi:hypothetical protein
VRAEIEFPSKGFQFFEKVDEYDDLFGHMVKGFRLRYFALFIQVVWKNRG